MNASNTAEIPEQRPVRWAGFWPWLAVTALLALAAAALGWHLSTRTAQVIEVTGPAPPPLPPTAAQTAEAERLRTQIDAAQSRLSRAIDAINPPVCKAPKELDTEKFNALRQAEAGNLNRWRALLVPVAPLPQSRPVATPGAPPVIPNTATTTPATTNPTAAPERVDGPVVEALAREAMSDRLERASAMVLGLPGGGKKGLFTGTGFFVGPNVLVTNRHVIEKADPGSLYVTSRALTRMHRVELLAASGTSTIGQKDFAALRLTGGEAPAHVALALGTDKLAGVVAAGYPSLGLKTDEGFRALLKGDLSAAPDLNMNTGEIRSIQRRGEITQIVHTADVLQGYSGGPLMDDCGRVIGMNTFIQVDQKQAGKLNNALATTDLLAFLGAHGLTARTDARACAAE